MGEVCSTNKKIEWGGFAMKIAGLQKMTLLDYPGKVACTVFLQGCNFRCPFCHNSDLLPGQGEFLMDDAELLAFLEKRKGLLDGVCVTGGEPTLQPQLLQLLKSIKELGYAVKLDTNGARPQVLRELVEAGVVDYVAMDIKNSREEYPKTAGIGESLLPHIEESIRYLVSGKVDYEFRTTVAHPLHSAQSIEAMGKWVSSLNDGVQPKRWYLQLYVERESVLAGGLLAPSKENMGQYCRILSPYAEIISLRGVD